MEELKEGPVGDPLDLENWYDALQEWTFPTVFLELRHEELEAICQARDGKKGALERLAALEERLGEVLPPAGAFVRLSTRSAKDWCLRAERTVILFRQEREALVGVADENTVDVIALVRAMSRALRVSSARDVIMMLTQSQRAYEDCTRRLLLGSSGPPMQLVVRKWFDGLLPELELRAFVHNRRLTALSQYYKACFTPDMVGYAKQIEAAALALFDAIKDRLQLDSYVLDLCYLISEDKCMLVELNHFQSTTSSALFDWKDDIEQIENGPFEFRYVREPIPNVRGMIARPLREMAGWGEVESIVSSSSVHKLLPAIDKTTKAKKSRRVMKLVQAEARLWQPCLGNYSVASALKGLQTAAVRRRPNIFWTNADVTLLCEASNKKFIRGEVAKVSPETCVSSSLYVVLFARVCPDLAPLLPLVEECEHTIGLYHQGDLKIDLSNTALVLRELGLIAKKKK